MTGFYSRAATDFAGKRRVPGLSGERHGKIGLAFTLDHHFRQFGFDVVPASAAAKR